MSLTSLNKALISGALITVSGGAATGAYLLLTTPETVKDALIKSQKNPLNLDQKTEEDIDVLKELSKKYHGNSLGGKKKINGFELSSATDFQNLESKCRELLNTKSNQKEFKDNLEHANNWCSKDTAPRSVKSLLDGKNKKLLIESDGNAWNQGWTKFKQKYSTETPAGNWEITGWAGINKDDSNIPQEFKKKCTDNGEKSLTPSEITIFLEEIINYCTKNK